MYSSTLSLTRGLDGGGLVNATHRSPGPREGATISFKRKAGRASWPTGTGVDFEPRIFQIVASSVTSGIKR
jgi:hypothetical protein